MRVSVCINQTGELRQFGDIISRRLGCRYANDETLDYLHLVRSYTHHSLYDDDTDDDYDYYYCYTLLTFMLLVGQQQVRRRCRMS